MSILSINKKSKLDSKVTEELIHKCMTVAARKVGSMRGVIHGDVALVVQSQRLKKTA